MLMSRLQVPRDLRCVGVDAEFFEKMDVAMADALARNILERCLSRHL